MTDPAYLLDTNICIYAIEALSQPLGERLARQREGSVFVSTISVAGLAVGYNGEDAPELAALLSEIVALPFDEAAARTYGALPFKRARFDRLIAAHAVSAGLTLVTSNEADFADVPGLKVENWTV